MQRVILLRLRNEDTGSEGVLYFLKGVLLALELPWRDNEPSYSCIPTGTYTARWWKSPSKGWCYRVYGVPGRSYILIHSATFAGDRKKKLRSDLRGCITLGKRRGVWQGQRGIFNSRSAVSEFNRALNKRDFLLEVCDVNSYRTA